MRRRGRPFIALAMLLGLGTGGCDQVSPGSDSARSPESLAADSALKPDAPPPASGAPSPGVHGLPTALARGISAPGRDDATYRVDPFVAALVFDELRTPPGRAGFEFVSAADPRPAGYRVVTAPEDSLWGRLGLRPDDVIEALNGVDLTGPERLGPALDGAEHRVTLTIFREDVSFTASYRLDGGLAWRDVLSGFSGTPEPEVEESPEPSSPPVADEPGPASPSRLSGAARPRGSKPSKPSGMRTQPRGSAGGAPTTPGRSDIRCASASQCSIAKDTFDDLVASPQRLKSQVDIVPAIRNDVHSGYKLRRVSSGSAVHRLGFRAGDKITHVNGRFLGDDAQAMALYWSLGSTRVFKVRFERGGRKSVKTISVR